MNEAADNVTHSVWLRTRESLIARVKGEESEEPWAEFYQMYWRAIYGYAIHFGLEADAAEDVVQEVFIKILRKLPSFEYDRKRGRFLSWVKTITRTTVYDFFRRRKARIEGKLRVEARDDGDSPLEHIADPKSPDVPDPWQAEWQQSLLALALERVKERVDEKTFQAFFRCALENEPPVEVAEQLQMSANSVYVAKSRITKLLRDEVAVLREEAS